ncbi:MAG: hypothetical protein ACRYG4_26705, partial [Janthinobacterium lividum]
MTALLLATTAAAQVPAADLAKPPAGATHYVIESTGGRHGDSWTWTTDGMRMGRESMNLRGQVWETDYSGKAGADGMPVAMAIRGVTPSGDAGETFDVADGKAEWKSPIDSGSAAYAAPAFYASQGGPAGINLWFLEQLLASPDKTMALLPGGKAIATRLTSTDVGSGTSRKSVVLWAISGVGTSPFPVWATTDDKVFA